jgi:hypothetical protein
MIGGCARRVVVLLLLAGVVAGAWLFRDPLRSAWQDLRSDTQPEPVPSAELAAVAEEKLTGVRDGTSQRVALSTLELESLVLFRYDGLLPAFLDTPRIELDGDQLRLRARVPLDMLPRVDGIGEIAAYLPDTTELAITGKLVPLETGRVAYAIDAVSASRIPLPMRLVPGALDRLGRRPEPGLPRDAVALPLPAGVGTAYVRRDSLVLLAADTARD